MKKVAFVAGMGTGFVVGSWAGRGPYRRLEDVVRHVVKQPKVQTTLHSAAESAAAVRDATLDATTEAIDGASKAAGGAIEETSRKVANGAHKVASKVGNSS
jgi:hypothetical protein